MFLSFSIAFPYIDIYETHKKGREEGKQIYYTPIYVRKEGRKEGKREGREDDAGTVSREGRKTPGKLAGKEGRKEGPKAMGECCAASRVTTP